MKCLKVTSEWLKDYIRARGGVLFVDRRVCIVG